MLLLLLLLLRQHGAGNHEGQRREDGGARARRVHGQDLDRLRRQVYGASPTTESNKKWGDGYRGKIWLLGRRDQLHPAGAAKKGGRVRILKPPPGFMCVAEVTKDPNHDKRQFNSSR